MIDADSPGAREKLIAERTCRAPPGVGYCFETSFTSNKAVTSQVILDNNHQLSISARR